LRDCAESCQGLNAAKHLKGMTHGNLEILGKVYTASVGHLPKETQQAVNEYLKGGKNLGEFEKFMDDQV